jgi:hypothetical protein
MIKKFIEQLYCIFSLRRLVLKVWVLLVLFMVPFVNVNTQALAFEDKSAEYILKAGFLYNFTQFIEWPEETASLSDTLYAPFDFSICVIGRDPFGNLLEVLAKNLKNEGRPMNVLRLGLKDPWYDCHILFVPKEENSLMEKILKKVANSPVLVISEAPSQGERKPAINFLIKNDTIQFTLNKEAIKRSGLRVDSELLDIALEVD